MKNVCKKLQTVFEYVIGILLAICLFGGGLGFFGFAAAFCAGGDIAGEICMWLSNVYYAILIKLSTITTFLTFILMYLNGSARWVNPFRPWKSKK